MILPLIIIIPVHKVLQRIHNAELTIKASKFLFGCNYVISQGHLIGWNTVRFQGILDSPMPIMKKDLKVFLGLIVLHHHLIGYFS